MFVFGGIIGGEKKKKKNARPEKISSQIILIFPSISSISFQHDPNTP